MGLIDKKGIDNVSKAMQLFIYGAHRDHIDVHNAANGPEFMHRRIATSSNKVTMASDFTLDYNLRIDSTDYAIETGTIGAGNYSAAELVTELNADGSFSARLLAKEVPSGFVMVTTQDLGNDARITKGESSAHDTLLSKESAGFYPLKYFSGVLLQYDQKWDKMPYCRIKVDQHRRNRHMLIYEIDVHIFATLLGELDELSALLSAYARIVKNSIEGDRDNSLPSYKDLGGQVSSIHFDRTSQFLPLLHDGKAKYAGEIIVTFQAEVQETV